MMNFTAWHIFLGYSKKTNGVSWFEVSVENGHLEACFCVGVSSHLCVCLSRSILKFCCGFWASTADVWHICLFKEAIYPVPFLLLKFYLLQFCLFPDIALGPCSQGDMPVKAFSQLLFLAMYLQSQIFRMCSLKAPSLRSLVPLWCSDSKLMAPFQFITICFELAFG